VCPVTTLLLPLEFVPQQLLPAVSKVVRGCRITNGARQVATGYQRQRAVWAPAIVLADAASVAATFRTIVFIPASPGGRARGRGRRCGR
jgi:hypothetical protein